ncbi:MAG: hypothetical protein COB12_09490 [Flavobacterium sp.]|nr:MAG: hypothetical protein COB12_09490 [Flavobacterium sp.]
MQKQLIIGVLSLALLSCEQQKEQVKNEITTENEYEYIGGYPTDATVEKAFYQLDLQRASQVYLEFIPLTSQNSIFRAHNEDYGMKKTGDVGIYTEMGTGKAGAIGLTYNTESIYASAHCDLKIDGPVVIETPSNVLGIVDDGWMRYVTDLGNAGPDKGKGGKYLLLPPGYKGDIPEGYFVFECPTYRNWIMVRGFTEETGTGQNALDYYRKNLKIYPLETGPREDAIYVSMTGMGGNTTHPRDASYFDFLNEIVQYEPATAFTPYELGVLQSIGIEKGKDFNPDARMKEIYKKGVERGEAMAKANAYANRLEGVRIYDDRKYERLFIGDYTFQKGDALWIDARTLFHYEAIVVTPAMTRKMIGNGSQYLICYRDKDDNFMMGEHNYKLNIPANIPAETFWSVTVYHPDTRSLLQNGEDKPSVSMYDKPIVNEDGSIDLYFGPEAPEGQENNWVKTIPGEGWEILFRLYGPTEAFFDQTWRPNDFEKLN